MFNNDKKVCGDIKTLDVQILKWFHPVHSKSKPLFDSSSSWTTLVSSLDGNWKTSGPALSHSVSKDFFLLWSESTILMQTDWVWGILLNSHSPFLCGGGKCKWNVMCWLLLEHERHAGHVSLLSCPYYSWWLDYLRFLLIPLKNLSRFSFDSHCCCCFSSRKPFQYPCYCFLGSASWMDLVEKA